MSSFTSPNVPPPILAGVRGPKSIDLAGRLCDGVLLAEPASPQYVRWVRAVLADAAGNPAHVRRQVAAYTWFSVDADPGVAQARLRPALAEGLMDPEAGVHLQQLPFRDELLNRLAAARDADEREQAIDLNWVTQLSVAGTPEDCAAAITALADAGARIILLPAPRDETDQLRRFARDVRLLLP
jgi:alkanesulfonate monooxygenase SsuD/methylene tetrahydromethanopterin reductase-like flavin-dependent oxidoreductase (luciferase family)